jgi:hypothetical protein
MKPEARTYVISIFLENADEKGVNLATIYMVISLFRIYGKYNGLGVGKH